MSRKTTHQRDCDIRTLVDDMDDGTVNAGYYDLDAIVDFVAAAPAPRFYLAPDKARQYIYRYKQGTYVAKTPMLRQKMRDLVAVYDRLRQQYPHLPGYKICELAVEQPAQSFYLKPTTIREIIKGYAKRTK